MSTGGREVRPSTGLNPLSKGPLVAGSPSWLCGVKASRGHGK